MDKQTSKKQTLSKSTLIIAVLIAIIIVLLIILLKGRNPAKENTAESAGTTIENTFSTSNADTTAKIDRTIIDENGITIKLADCFYTENASDIIITFDIINNSAKGFTIQLKDVMVADASLRTAYGNDDYLYQPKTTVSTRKYISLDDLRKSEVTDFNTMSFKLVCEDKEGNNLFSRDVIVERDQFTGRTISITDADKEALDNSEVDITTKNRIPVLVDADGLEIAVKDFKYIKGESDITIVLTVSNETKNIIDVAFENMTIDGKAIDMPRNTVAYDAGASVYSHYYVPLVNLQKANVTDFSSLAFDFIVKTSEGDSIVERKIIMDREAFSDALTY